MFDNLIILLLRIYMFMYTVYKLYICMYVRIYNIFYSSIIEVIGNNPFNLSFLLWVAMCKGEMRTSFLVLCVQQLFPHMKTNTNKLSSRCDVDTLCHFDMEVSTYIHTSASITSVAAMKQSLDFCVF